LTGGTGREVETGRLKRGAEKLAKRGTKNSWTIVKRPRNK
jgi:hypothetical protein